MKQIYLIFFIAILTINNGCSQTESGSVNSRLPKIVFEKVEHDYGTIPQKGDGTCEFVFKNKGKEPLILNNVRSSCGCTVPEWPKEPIKKGKKGVIKVKYNTNRAGSFKKSIAVYSNASSSPITLTIKGVVEQPKPEE